MEHRIIYDALFVGIQTGILLCLGIVMIVAGRGREKYTRRIHLLTGLLCCLLALEFAVPSLFMEETLDVYYRGISNAYTEMLSSVVVQADNLLSYPLLAMVLFSLFQAFRPIPFRMILFPLALPAILLVLTIASFAPEWQRPVCDIFWGIYASITVASFISGIKGYRKYCKDNYSDTTGLSLKWLSGIPILLIPVLILDRYVYGGHQDSLVLALVSEISLLLPAVYLAWFAHRQTPAGECPEVLAAPATVESETGSEPVTQSGVRLLDLGMIDKLSLLLEEKCIQSQAFLDPQLTRSKLAVILGTNSTYLSRYFAQNGTNFNEYINGLRLDYACRMIQDSTEKDIALSRIAAGSGFNHYRTFSRLFVGRFGVSPADWRRDNSQNNVQNQQP